MMLRNNLAKSFEIPTAMFLRSIEPQKDSGIESKLQFSFIGGKTMKNLPEVFDDFFQQQGNVDESCKKEGRHLSFQYHDGINASILISRDGSKIKIQTGSLDRHWLVLKELTNRFETYFDDMPIQNFM